MGRYAHLKMEQYIHQWALYTQVSTIVNVFQHFFNRGLAWWNHGYLGVLVAIASNLNESSFLEFFGATPILQATLKHHKMK